MRRGRETGVGVRVSRGPASEGEARWRSPGEKGLRRRLAEEKGGEQEGFTPRPGWVGGVPRLPRGTCPRSSSRVGAREGTRC